MMPPYRQNRLFHESGRCLAIAVDHGFPGEPSLLAGIEDMPAAIDRLVGAGPDAILLSPGQAGSLQRHLGRGKPALVLRTDTGNVFGPELPDRGWSLMVEDPVGLALRLDAAAVVVNLLDMPSLPDIRRQCAENVTRLRAACDRAGMPLMVEALAFAGREGSYASTGDADRIAGVVRQAVELGADVIKCDPTDDPADLPRIVRVAARPVLPRGGGRVGERALLERTQELVGQGAAGIVYGRNVIQHDEPARMVAALNAVVHEGTGAEQAHGELVGV